MRIDAETLAALGEGRLTPAEVETTLAQLTDEDKAALRDLFPIRHHLLFCEPGCGHPGVETQRPEGFVRIHAGLEQQAAMSAARSWMHSGWRICIVSSPRANRWHVYRATRTPSHAEGSPDLSNHLHLPKAACFDLSSYFAPGAMKAQIPDDLDIGGMDLRANGRAVWTVSRDAEGKRWAELDTLCNPAVGTVEWAR